MGRYLVFKENKQGRTSLLDDEDGNVLVDVGDDEKDNKASTTPSGLLSRMRSPSRYTSIDHDESDDNDSENEDNHDPEMSVSRMKSASKYDSIDGNDDDNGASDVGSIEMMDRLRRTQL